MSLVPSLDFSVTSNPALRSTSTYNLVSSCASVSSLPPTVKWGLPAAAAPGLLPGTIALMSAIVPGSSPGAAAAGKPHLTVGGKLDTEAQLLTKLYVLVLRKAGFDVTEKSKLGTNDIVHNAIVSGQIDLYPEFTATGLARLKLKTTHDDQKDYALVKAGYQKQFRITWLAMSPLNDTYGICTTQAGAGKLGTKVSALAEAAPRLTVASPPDGTSDPNVLPGMKAAYGFTFGKTTVLDEALTFPAVQQGKADVNVCYT